jgi:tRNA A-37 threonylcarbamoyl transferase component Bud32
MEAPDANAQRSTILKAELFTRVEVLGQDGTRVVRKTYRSRPFLLWRTFLLSSRAAREYRNLAAIHSAGVPCVRPLSWTETRVAGCVPECAVITEFVDDAPSLKDVMAGLDDRNQNDARLRRRLCAWTGRLVRELHAAGFVSCRITPRNFLVQHDASGPRRLLLCDQPAAAWFRRSAIGRDVALIDLYDMAFSRSRIETFTGAERLRTVLGYTEGDRATARALWRRLARRPRWWNRALRGAVSFFGSRVRVRLRSMSRRDVATHRAPTELPRSSP